MTIHKDDPLILSRLQEVMQKEPLLNAFGIGLYLNGRGKSVEERRSELTKDREALLADIKSVEWCASWLSLNVKPTKTINDRHNSYGLKHIAEKFYSPGEYLTNGTFIAAAIIAGYAYQIIREPNVYFGMGERSIKALYRQAQQARAGYSSWTQEE